MINEAPNGPAKLQERDTRVESEYEYGSRVGFWRLFRMFNKHDIKFTLYAVGQALECNPAAGKRSVEMGHDIASHAYRWIDYQGMPPEEEKVYIKKAIESIQDICGAPPKGWFYGRMSPRSVPLVWEVHNEMGIPLVWMSDSYADEVPYWIDIPAEKNESNPKGLLMVPYSYDCNDYKFNMDTGFAGPSDFYEQIKNTCMLRLFVMRMRELLIDAIVDVLYEEGCDGSPKMMTVALHCRCVGKPARFAALKKFVEYIKEKDDVWIATVCNDSPFTQRFCPS